MYENECKTTQLGKRMTEAEKIMQQSRELINYAEGVAKLSDEKLTKIINDGPKPGRAESCSEREHYSPMWGDMADNLARVRGLLRHIESRLEDAEI